MIRSLTSAAQCMNGVLHGSDQPFSGVSTDTRSIDRGQLFFALRGPNFDGHDHVASARAGGAAAAVVSRLVDEDIAQISVDDTKQALGRFAKAWRRNHDVSVVGVTGSNGKTTLKEMIYACLKQVSATLATSGNLNNDIGLPLMMSRIEPEHKFAVLEMGANHPGEIAYLTSLASPDVVVITNAGPAHLEGFGSVEGVAKAKGEILQDDDRPMAAVLNADDEYFSYWSTLVKDIDVIRFGFSSDADVRADRIDLKSGSSEFQLQTPIGSAMVSLPLVGVHNVRNACAAAAVAIVLGLDLATITRALQDLAPVDGRLHPLPGLHGSALYDDSYNANPSSVIAAAEFLASLDGENWLVLGDMKELGEGAKELHRRVGASARTSGIDRLFVLGDLAKFSADEFGRNARHYETMEALLADLADVGPGINVLVKGSRSMRMERVVTALRSQDAARVEV